MLSPLLSLAILTAEAAAAAPDPLPWIADDWEAAKARATKESKLVAVDVWATWCHTCMSMKSFVLKEPPMKALASEHVWLALDYDLPKNAAFFAKFPVSSFPTFLVVDPEKETVVGRWVGSGTSREMATFFKSSRKSAEDPIALAERALAKAEWARAAEILGPEVEKQPAKGTSKAERTRLLSRYIEALYNGDKKACAEKGVRHLDEVDDNAPGLDFVALVSYCGEGAGEALASKVRIAVRDRLEKTLGNKAAMAKLSADDISGLYSMLIEAYDGLKDEARAKALVERRLAVLEDAAKKAKTPAARSTFDPHRLECYIRLKRFDVAEQMLKASESAMPADFNPPARLALLFMEQGRFDDGLAAIERALQRGYGPRRFRLHTIKIDLLTRKKDFAAAKKAVAAAKLEIEAMDKALVRKEWPKRLEDKLAEIAKLENDKP